MLNNLVDTVGTCLGYAVFLYKHRYADPIRFFFFWTGYVKASQRRERNKDGCPGYGESFVWQECDKTL